MSCLCAQGTRSYVALSHFSRRSFFSRLAGSAVLTFYAFAAHYKYSHEPETDGGGTPQQLLQ